jgi:hypothetical protein
MNKATRYTVWDIDAMSNEDMIFVSAEDYNNLFMQYMHWNSLANAREERIQKAYEALGYRVKRARSMT